MSNYSRICKYCGNSISEARQGEFCQKGCRLAFKRFQCKSRDRTRKDRETYVSTQFDADGNDVRYS